MARFKAGDTAFIVESNRIIRKVTIKRCTGGIYLIKFEDGGGIQVKEHRLFATYEEANASILPAPKKENEKRKYRSPYDYDH